MTRKIGASPALSAPYDPSQMKTVDYSEIEAKVFASAIFPLPVSRVTMNMEVFLHQLKFKDQDDAYIEDQFQKAKNILYEAFDEGRICQDGFREGMKILNAARSSRRLK